MKISVLGSMLKENRYDFDDDSGDHDELPRGASHGDHYEHDEESLTVGQFKINFAIHQRTINVRRPTYRDDPPDDSTYLSDADNAVINSIVFVPKNFDVPDIDFTIGFPITDREIVAFTQMMIKFGEDNYDGEDLENYNKYVGYSFHNNPDLGKNILGAIQHTAENIYKGEM
jgi:hypothetical protein